MTSPWATPDTAPSQPTRSGDDPVAAATAVGAPLEAPLPPPPLLLQPMTVPDLLDGSFAILKRRPRDVLVLAAAFVIPAQLLSALLLRDVLVSSGFGGTGLGDPTSSVGVEETGELTGVGTAVLAYLLDAVSLSLLAGALALLVGDWYRGEREPPSRTIVRTLRRGPALLVSVVLVRMLEVVGLVGVGVGAIVAMALLHVVSPVVTAEHAGPFRAIGRSFRLTRGRFWRSLAVPLLVGLTATMIGVAFQIIPEVVALVVSDGWAWLVRSSGSILAQLVVAPFTAGAAVLYHLDLRMRVEGHDLGVRLGELERAR